MLNKATSAEIRLHGIGVSPGIARGPVLLSAEVLELQEAESISPGEVEGELEKFAQAVEETQKQLEKMRHDFALKAGTEEAAIFDAHILMLEDRVFLDETRDKIRNTPERAVGAFQAVAERYAQTMRSIDDDYLRERAADIEDVARRVVRNLLGHEEERGEKHPHILLAHDITPSSAASMDRETVLAMATEAGSFTSHTAIIARSMGIPAVVGLHSLCDGIHGGQEALVDGYEGIVILNPDEETLARYAQTQRQKSALARHLEEMRDAPAITLDGCPMVLSANIEFEKEMEAVQKSGANGVGLYRTEFLYLNRVAPPSEEEQAANYARVAEKSGPHGAIIRTLDIGGDKLHGLHRNLEESNPFLGWRGIRVSLAEGDLFRTQLRAILRASVRGKLRVMFPMISCLAELREAKMALAECQEELASEGVAFDAGLEVGTMIEVPSAALTADTLAREVDFFSVGTNDLIQYTMAVDRGNERVSNLYQPCHPAMVRLMKSVAEAATKAGIWAGVCGEMAGDIRLTPLLVGLGFAELSVAFVQLPYIKYAIRKLDAAACRAMVEELHDMEDSDRVHNRVKEMALEYYPELLA